MVHLKAHQHGHGDIVTNHPHQHAFMILGTDPIYGVHMTQYHCEEHKYQLIMRFSIPDDVRDQLLKLRETYPNDGFVLCNAKGDPTRGIEEMTVPDIASGHTSEFLGNIFQGMRFPEKGEVIPEHYFPWSADRCRPAIAEVPIKVERIVMFRPFAHQDTRPPHPSFLMWGEGDEAHMTNIQTGSLASGPFEAEAFGPDIDYICSLAEPPAWLDKGLLAAGSVVSVPSIDMYGMDSWKPEPFFKKDQDVVVLYRGVGATRRIKTDVTYLAGTAVCNSPETDPFHGQFLYISEMPSNYHETL